MSKDELFSQNLKLNRDQKNLNAEFEKLKKQINTSIKENKVEKVQLGLTADIFAVSERLKKIESTPENPKFSDLEKKI